MGGWVGGGRGVKGGRGRLLSDSLPQDIQETHRNAKGSERILGRGSNRTADQEKKIYK